MEQFYTLLTNVGKAKIANAISLGTKVNITKFQAGDSNGAYYNPTEDQTALRNRVWETSVVGVTQDEANPNWIKIEDLLPSDVGGFEIREVAVLDEHDSGDRDKAVAIIMKEFLPNSTIVDIADYKSYMCRNAYAIGGGASKGLEKYPDSVTKFVGNDFKETYKSCRLVGR
ncbi:phage tail protein [Metaclostridioides mangenotii]|uniref:phage tail protein n=1 Tax=Metaclostridioides mangenotii TaxID=1540 RepID=UPI0004801B7D|nr:phage tail protein [Clostridioides mangenotii]